MLLVIAILRIIFKRRLASILMLCQVFFLKLHKRQLLRIGVGVVFTYIGLVVFLTGVNVGYMPIGYKMGGQLASLHPALLVGLGLLMGILVVMAEPAIHVLNAQVEEVTGGYVEKKSMMFGLCTGVGVASGPMTSGFILPFAVGVCVALQGENAVLRDGFGVVALVAMAPLITIQLLGFKAIVSNKIKERRAMQRILQADDEYIINFM